MSARSPYVINTAGEMLRAGTVVTHGDPSKEEGHGVIVDVQSKYITRNFPCLLVDWDNGDTIMWHYPDDLKIIR